MAADGTAVLNADDERVAGLATRCRARGQRVLTFGTGKADIQLLARHDTEQGQRLSVAVTGTVHEVALPLPGAYQALNALAALGLALATGVDATDAIRALHGIDGVPGRLQRVSGHPAGAAVFVDYAHTPDALAAALQALRPLVPGTLVVVFGCGGERDVGKRREMGEIAASVSPTGSSSPTTTLAARTRPRSARLSSTPAPAPRRSATAPRPSVFLLKGSVRRRWPAHRRQGA